MARSILALGAGAMGAKAACTLAPFDEVGRMTVADLNLESARRVGETIGAKATAVAVDVMDHDGLVALMRGHDVVMNCVGPFFRFGEPVLAAAIEARVDYLDICDDPLPTRNMLDRDADAREAGITGVIGMGASPGINNLLGACVRARLDETDSLLAAWSIEGGEGDDEGLSFSAAVVHWLEQCSGTILQCEGGRLVEVAPLQEVSIDYPGRGRHTLFTVGHPEPVSFHYTWPDVRETSCVMVMPVACLEIFRRFQGIIDQGAMTLEEASLAFCEEVMTGPWLGMLGEASQRDDSLPSFFVLGRGRVGGRPRVVAASLAASLGDMAAATGLPLALGTLLHLRGQTRRKGLMAPEAAFDPATFFEMLVPWCTPPAPGSGLVVIEEAEAGVPEPAP